MGYAHHYLKKTKKKYHRKAAIIRQELDKHRKIAANKEQHLNAYRLYQNVLQEELDKCIPPLHNEIAQIRNNKDNYSKVFFGLFTSSRLKLEIQENIRGIELKIRNEVDEIHKRLIKPEYDEREISAIERKIYWLERELEEVTKKEALNRKKKEQTARLAAAENKSRDLAARIKHQLDRDHLCPYCFGPLGSNSCADHIYPISKGGHSTIENMVMVCYSCNSKKTDLTLRTFIKRYQLDRIAIEEALSRLGKDY